ncbi:hypothetical protein M9435_002863 [Picochlorum sp. BPE23]|nr:hypothetical protein M9435_002863 [Picochlorum sp. BPE23]
MCTLRSVGSPWRLWMITVTMLVMVHHIHASRYLDGLGVRSGRGVLATVDDGVSALETEQASVAVKVEEDMVQQSQKDVSTKGEEKSRSDRTFDVIIDSSEDGKSTTFNPTPVFVVDFGRNVTAKNPLKMFEISGSNRVDVLYSPSLGLLYVLAAVSDRESPQKVTLQVQQGVTEDVKGQLNEFAEKTVEYVPYEDSSGANIISDVAAWGMLGGLAMSFGATLISPNAAIGIGAMNFAGFVQTFYMSGNLPITNMPENYRAAANGLDWVGLNPPYGPAAPSTNTEQEEAREVLQDLAVRLPYPPKNVTGIKEDTPVTQNPPGENEEEKPQPGPASDGNVTQVVVVNLPEDELVDQDGKPPNPFKDDENEEEEDKEEEKEEDVREDNGDEDKATSEEKVPAEDSESAPTTPDEEANDGQIPGIVPLDADLSIVPLQKDPLSPPPPTGISQDAPADTDYTVMAVSPESDEYAYVQPLFGSKAPAPAPYTENAVEEAYEDLYYTYEDAAYFLDQNGDSVEQIVDSGDDEISEGDDPHKGNPEKGNPDKSNPEKGNPNKGNGNAGQGKPPNEADDGDTNVESNEEADEKPSIKDEETDVDNESLPEDGADDNDDTKEDEAETNKEEKDLSDETTDEIDDDADGDEEDYVFVDPLIGGHDDSQEAEAPEPTADQEETEAPEPAANEEEAEAPEPADNEEEAEAPEQDTNEEFAYEDTSYTYEDPNYQIDDEEHKTDDMESTHDETDEETAPEPIDELDEGQRRRKLLLADPLASLASSGFSYVVATATPEDVSKNGTVGTSTEEAVGASVMSRIRAIQVSADGGPTDAQRLDVLWNVLFWSAMLLSAVFFVHAIILMIMKILKCETTPKMLHLPRLELLTFTIMLPMIAAAGAAALQAESAGAIAAGVIFGVLIPFGYLFGAGIFLALAVIRPTISKRRAVYVVQQSDNLNISAPSPAQIETLRHSTDPEVLVESSNGSQSSVGLETSMLTTQMRNDMVEEEEPVSEQPQASRGAEKKRFSAFLYRWIVSPIFGFRSPYRVNHGDQSPAWLGRGKLDGEFVKRFGCFFEDAHGPQVYRVRSRYETVQNEESDTANGGILVSVGVEGAMEILQTFGIIFAALKMVLFAVIINGPGGVDNVAQVVVLTLVALLHILYLRICVPYRLRVELAAEIVAALCDMGVFICGIILVAKKDWTETERNSMGIAMLVLQAVGFLIFITVRVSLAIRTSAMTIAPSVQSWYRNRKK